MIKITRNTCLNLILVSNYYPLHSVTFQKNVLNIHITCRKIWSLMSKKKISSWISKAFCSECGIRRPFNLVSTKNTKRRTKNIKNYSYFSSKSNPKFKTFIVRPLQKVPAEKLQFERSPLKKCQIEELLPWGSSMSLPNSFNCKFYLYIFIFHGEKFYPSSSTAKHGWIW